MNVKGGCSELQLNEAVSEEFEGVGRGEVEGEVLAGGDDEH